MAVLMRRKRHVMLTWFVFAIGLYTTYHSQYFFGNMRTREQLRYNVAQQKISLHNQSTPLSGQACRHPELLHNHPSLRKFYKKPAPIVCDSEPNWVCVDARQQTVRVCERAAESHPGARCSYTWLQRESDWYTEDGHTVASTSETVSIESDFFRVECRDDRGNTWDNVMATVLRDSAGKGSRKIRGDGDATGLNVIIWGFDSLSRLAFMRNLPKSFKFLTEHLSAVVLKGYNIVGDGTPQALIPILTGKTELELPETRQRMGNEAQPVDVYPFIWKDFGRKGYATAFAEDCPNLGTFTYRLKGFTRQPTDHYMRTFYLAAEPEYPNHNHLCLRSQPRHKVMMDWVSDFANVYADKPKFAFAFHGELSHDDWNLISVADDDTLNFLQSLKSQGHLDNTMLIVMSDHGHRFADVRDTQQGKQEERLPFFAIALPDSFKKRYPSAWRNLQVNSDRLTTPFDIYPTLQDVLRFTGGTMGDINSRGISLFNEVPPSRTCLHADIEAHWCACLTWETIPTDGPFVMAAAEAVIKLINDYTSVAKDLCVPLTLNRIAWAGKFVPGKDMMRFKKAADSDGFVGDFSDNTKVSEEMYQVKFDAQPGGGHFEASLRYIISKKLLVPKIEDISRVNKYGSAASCVQDHMEQLRKYCYCRH